MLYWLLIFIALVLLFAKLFGKEPSEKSINDVKLAPSKEIENNNYFDVVIIGAGISGISAAQTLITRCSKKVFFYFLNNENILTVIICRVMLFLKIDRH